MEHPQTFDKLNLKSSEFIKFEYISLSYISSYPDISIFSNDKLITS